MARSVPTVPANLTAQMLPFQNLSAPLVRGTCVGIDGSGNLIPVNNSAPSPIPTIGIVVNNALPGEACYVQIEGLFLDDNPEPTTIFTPGDLCGSINVAGQAADLGAINHFFPLSPGATQSVSLLGVIVAGTSDLSGNTTSLTIQILPLYVAGINSVTPVASDVGKNMGLLPLQLTSDTGDSNFSFNLRIPGGLIAGIGRSFTLRYNAGTGGTTALVGAVVRRTLRGSSVWLDSTPILWGGVGNPTFAAGSSNVSDAVTLTIDTAHDYYIIVAVGVATGVTTPAISNTAMNGNGGEQPGDQRATADATTLNFTSMMPGIAQAVIAS